MHASPAMKSKHALCLVLCAGAFLLADKLHARWPPVETTGAGESHGDPSSANSESVAEGGPVRLTPSDDLTAAAMRPDLRVLRRGLAAAVYERHVVRDERRPTFGMTYEFWRDGRNYQDMGLDALHDGAWFTVALITAHRADPEGGQLAQLQRYQVPFYVNLLRHSDRLFPDIRQTDEDRAPLAHPWRGRLPLAWEDGGGFDLNTGKPLPPAYNAHQGPNHLAQDVADALLNVWLTTRDTNVAEALRLLHEERAANFGTIATWEGIWREMGTIPSGYRGTHLRNRFWELSDAGNHAHLIRLIALRLLDLRGESEWRAIARLPMRRNE